jgi:hypothetical protein
VAYDAKGFAYALYGTSVRITHHGRPAAMLRGFAAEQFLKDVVTGNPQQLMARATNGYKRGDERVAREHPRNRGR